MISILGSDLEVTLWLSMVDFYIVRRLTRMFILLLYVVFNFVNEVTYVNHVDQMSVSSLIYILPFLSVFEKGVLTSSIMIVGLSIFPLQSL